MFEGLRTNHRLRKLLRESQAVEGKYKKDLKEARASKRDNEVDALLSEMNFELKWIDSRRQMLKSRQILDQADKYFIPRPEIREDSEDWERSEFHGRFMLTPKAISELGASIRKEKRERDDQILRWITALIGVIGALIGLAAVILKA